MFKVTKATLDESNGSSQLPFCFLELSDGSTATLSVDFNAYFLMQGFVPVGRSDLPPQIVTYPDGQRVSIGGLLPDEPAAKALLAFADYRDEKQDFADGHVFYQSE